MKSTNAARAGNLYIRRTKGTAKKAQADLVEACGGLMRSADLIGKSRAWVHQCTDENEPDVELKLSQIRILERDCGQPIVTSFLALEARHALVPLDFDASSPLSTDMARLGERVSALFGRYAESMADGNLTAKEAAELKDEVHKALGALGSMLPDLDARMAEGN